MVPDVLGTEPPGRRAPSARRRRWSAAGVAVAVAATAFVLAGRSEPEPRTRVAPPTVTPRPAPGPRWLEGDEVRALGGTRRAAYALLATCRPAGCRFRLARRDSLAEGPRWLEVTGLPTEPDPGGLGEAELVTAGDDTVAIVEPGRARAWVSDDGGARFRLVESLPGPAVPAVPADLTADLGRCAGCRGQIGVFDPRTGRRGRLARQPPLDPPPTAFADSGYALWAASSTPDRITIATSTDRGRTWRTTSLRQTTPLRGNLHLAASGQTGYLLGESLDRRLPAQVWVSRTPAVAWRAVPVDPYLRGDVTGVVAGGDELVVSANGLVFTDAGGSVQKIGMQVPLVDSVAVAPGMVLARVSYGRPAVAVSSDLAAGWQIERLPG